MTALATIAILFCSVMLFAVVSNMVFWPRIRKWEGEDLPGVSVLIPARDEENRLASTLEAVLEQGPVVREVLVYDDHSTDGTAALVARYSEQDSRVRLVHAVALPEGWCGKPFACAQLAQAAACEWFLFLDADAILSEDAVARMVNEALARRVTFLSCWPGLVLGTFWERALMPMLNFCVFTLFPAPLSLLRNDASLGLAHGACILVRGESYRAVGGHETVRDEIFEDTRLARVWRERGHRGICLDGQDLVHVRMYECLGDIWRGFQKNFYPAFRSSAGFCLFLVFHFAFFLLPFLMLPVALLAKGMWPIFAASAAVLSMRLIMGIRFRYPLWSSLLHPMAEAMFIGLGISSWWRCRSGRGVEWKGRRYRAGATGGKS